jgi:hypothetical protein
MGRALGERGPKQTDLAMFFGFIFSSSSSCLFPALAASRPVPVKGHSRNIPAGASAALPRLEEVQA